MKRYFKKFKGIFCLVMCLCIAVATFQVGVFAEGDGTTTTPVTISSAMIDEGNNNKVFGNGIQTGTTDNGTATMDDKCWNPDTGENRGYDNSNANNIVRSFDIIKYNVVTTLNNLGGTAHKLGYQVTIPDDDALELTTDGANFTCNKSNGSKTYTFEWDVKANQSAGGIEHPFSIKVGNKHQGDTIKPQVSVYVDSLENKYDVTNVKEVIVTSAPMYNIVLKKGNLNTSKNVYDFKTSGSASTTADNAVDYKDKKVTGFRQVFGVGLEMKRPGNGIKGVELPDPDQGVTFDIDLSNYTIGGVSATDKGFVPLLYYYGANNAGGAQVTEIPFTNKNAAGNVAGSVYCDDSGTYTMTQEGSTLHVTVKGFSTDYNNFPKKNPKGDTYWETVEAMTDGFFSTFQFHVVYPYQNAAGKTLMEEFNIGDTGTANAKVTVDKMTAQCINKKDTTNTETIPLYNSDGSINNNNDNTQSETFTMSRSGNRDHKIIYSNRNESNWFDGYNQNAGNKDNDISVVGANDLAFSVSYDQSNVGEADESSQIPLAIEQMVLFDRNAIELEKNGHVDLSNQTGYTGSYKYLHHKNGRLSSSDMKSAKLKDFEINNDPTDCDGVLVQYIGCYNKNESSSLSQITRFFCNIKPNYGLSDKVYMITAVTNTWDASDLTDGADGEKTALLNHYNKTSLNDITRTQYSEWIKSQNINFFSRSHNISTIDHRDYYTVPEYENKIYNPSSGHQFSTNSADALYLVPYKVSIQKNVAQKGNDNKSLTQYNVSKKQRYVDYEVTSQLTFANNVQAQEGSKTTVYYEDTLDKGLTYIEGSMYIGGTYTSNFPSQGKVSGGQSITPEVINNKDGTTTLKWKVYNVSLRKTDLDKIHYSCKIGDEEDLDKDVAENATLKNDVKIQTDEDKRPYSATNDNEASTAITILKDKEFYLTKTSKELLELNDEGYFDLTITNTSSNDKNNLFVLDTMPSDGIGNTIMKGTYSLSEVNVNKKYLKNAEDYEVYYTSNPKYKGKTVDIVKESEVTEANGWKKATKTTEGDLVKFKGEGLIGSWPTAIVYKDDKLERDTIARIRIKYNAVAAKGDHLENSVSVPNGESYLHDEAKVDIVKRSLEGTVWVDKDKDGKLENKEKKVENVKVTLLKKNGDNYEPFEAYDEVVKDGDTYKTISHPTTITTDENGHYKFEGLPEGDFKVVFESSDKKDISNYEVTQSGQGTDEESSKVKEKDVIKTNEGKLSTGSILDIKMPSKEEMISKNKKEYNLPNQNLGLTVPTITISGTKTWNDNNNEHKKRPDSIKVNLLANGEKKDTKEVKSNNWKYEFTNLPKYDDDMNEIKYVIQEETVKGYVPTYNGYNITNTYSPDLTFVSGTKTWDDSNNQDGKRPQSITVNLKNGDKVIESKTVTANDNWSWNFTNLPKYDSNDNLINYTVSEDEVTDYTTTIKGYNITNTHTPEKISISGTKTWDDSSDQDGKRPSEITVKLLANGIVVKTTKATKNSDWKYSFKDLDKYSNGQEINYTIQEESVPNYTSTINGYDITNKHTPETVEIKGTKTWDDKDNQDGMRPTEIKITLVKKVGNQTTQLETKTVTADANGDWKYDFGTLPKYENGEKITYSITEDEVTGYKTTVDGYNITNTHTPEKISISGTKTWDDNNDQDGKRPERITVRLLADGKEVASKFVSASDNWSYEFKNLDKYENGQEINYVVTEDYVEGYETSIDGYDITNTHQILKTSVDVSKVWNDNNNQDGKRSDKVIVHLYADNKDTGKTLELNEANQWKGSFTDLDQYSKGKEIVYTVKEDTVKGYEVGITGSQETGYVLTNTHGIETVGIKGTKTWDDKDNQDGKRPERITVHLLADGQEVAVKEVTKEINWIYDFGNLAKYKDGKEIVYSVSEDEVDGYNTTINGYDITNKHDILKTKVDVSKVWNDNNNQDGKRSDKVIVHLYADNKDTGETLELSEANQWKGSFTGLNQYSKGKEIVYTVKEDTVKGYEVGITGSQDTGYVLTNTHGNETVEVKGTKTWDDQKDQDKVRPTKITIRLLADGKEIAVKEVTKETNWTYDFGNLAKYKDGKEIVYTISEDEVEGYKTSINGFNITNSHIPTTPSKPSTDKPSKDDQNPKGDQSSKNEQPTNGQTPVVKGETKTTSKEQTNKIKTGDDTHLILYVLFVVVSFMGILFLKKKAHN